MENIYVSVSGQFILPPQQTDKTDWAKKISNEMDKIAKKYRGKFEAENISNDSPTP